jgi:hypothetical protein
MRFSTSRRSTAVTADRSTVELRADLIRSLAHNTS